MYLLTYTDPLKTIFWISLSIVFYTYFGYGMLVWLLVLMKRFLINKKNSATVYSLPGISLIVAAYNEEDYIEKKIANTFQLDYPTELLELIFITDGSTDRTMELIGKYPAIKLLHQPERRGKVAAMNRAVQFVTKPVLVFCDANTELNRDCLRHIVKHYTDPKVGAVAGEKKILSTHDGKAAATGEGAYWKYESFLKRIDSELYSTVGAAGELFSIRTALFEKVPEGTIIEDFVQSLRVCVKGYVVRYEPEAYASEMPSESIREEMKRKVRICAGAFQAMTLLKELFNVFRYPVLSFQFLSHRILRWTLSPIALVTLLASNIFLVFFAVGEFYQLFLISQLLFYLLAITGWLYANKNVKIKLLYVPFYFFFMNVAVFIGFTRYVRKKQTVLWEKAARQKFA